MEVRGHRECKDCGTQWSYFETGSTACPECGSMHSVGISERALHTDRPVELDLAAAQDLAAAGSIREASEAAHDAAMAYIRGRGFIQEGELARLEETYVAAHELRHAAGELGRRLDVDAEMEHYFLSLLSGAPKGERPPSSDVPSALTQARGLGAATAVRAYRDDLRTWIDREPTVEEVRSLLSSIGGHVRRVRALDGQIPAAHADRLVRAARLLGEYLRGAEKSEETLQQAGVALDGLE